MNERTRLKELALLFFKLGTTAFGGPAAHIALMEDEVVRRRGWLTSERFLDLVGATNLIPGPSSTELAIHIGHQRAGWRGLVVAGSCFILPAALITLAMAWAYVRFGSLPQAGGLLYGMKPVIIAVVAQALWRLGQSAIKTRVLGAVALVGLVSSLLGLNELLLLLVSGWVVVGVRRISRGSDRGGISGGAAAILLLPMTAFSSSVGASATAVGAGATGAGAGATAVGAGAMVVATTFSLGKLFLFFAKVGSVLFGSGYVLLAFLRADLVDNWHWLTEAQLLDAIAVGQFTPGPLFTTATFIGYVLGGIPGALVATAGIFLPAFFFVALSGPLIPRLRQSPVAGAFLDGVNAASLALMAAVCWHLARAAVIDVPTALLALLSGVLLIRFKLNSVWVVLGGGIIGLGISLAESVLR